jgi:DDE superfamily endonuclease
LLPKSLTKFPYFIAADEAFPLSPNIMRPYGGRYLSDDKFHFNQRLSRAREVVENTFGILAARWRILHQSIEFKVDRIDQIIKATVALHNFLMDDEENYSDIDVNIARNNLDSLTFNQDIEVPRKNITNGEKYREILKTYLNNNKI